MICASTYNSHQVHKLSADLKLERIGTSVNPSLSLVNHSCNSNSIRCNVNKSSILVAVNPYQILPIYTAEQIKLYKEKKIGNARALAAILKLLN